MITALVRVRIALHPVTGGCGGHSCHSHDPPGFFVLVHVAATTQVGFRGLTVRGAHRRRRTVAGMGVVLDLPEPLIEAFPLVGLSVLVLALIIGEQVLGSQEGRFMRSKEEDGVFVGWGLHGTISNVINPGRPVRVALHLGKHQVPGLEGVRHAVGGGPGRGKQQRR